MNALRGQGGWLAGLSSLVVWWGLAGLPAEARAQPGPAPAAPDEFRVTLLGTGSPVPVMRRFGPGVLVEASGRKLLIDSGRGTTQRLFQLGVPLGKVDALFITHLHSDHIVGIPDLWLTGWLQVPYGGRQGAFRVYGPKGTNELMQALVKAYAWDIGARIADQQLPPEAVRPEVIEFTAGVVYDDGGVKVTAFEVDHGDLLKPAVGFRVDYAGRSVTVSGDTRFSENLIKHAAGTDLLVHQVAAVRDELMKNPLFQVILAHHTKPDEAGTLFTRVKPKLAVFYHFVLLGNIGVPPVTEQDVFDLARKTYDGPLLIGEDLMAFRLDRDAVVPLAALAARTP